MISIIKSLPEIQWCDLTKYKELRQAIVLTTPNSEKAAKDFLKKLNIKKTIYIQSSQKEAVDKILTAGLETEIVYAIGGGRVMDIGRYLANRWGLKIICIPTIISSDAFLVDCTGIRENGCVVYVQSKKADKVLLDINLLSKAPRCYNLSGCGDILSIYTALHDWSLANKNKQTKSDEKYSEAVANIAESILESLLLEKDEIKKGSRKGLEAILQAQILEVNLCNIYGNSRPEEGGEHFFTYCIENRTSHFLHGEIVSLGVLITAFLQKRDWRKYKDFMDEINLNYKPDAIDKQIVLAALQEMKNYVKRHKLRYTIYNEFDFNEHKQEIIKLLNILRIKN